MSKKKKQPVQEVNTSENKDGFMNKWKDIWNRKKTIIKYLVGFFMFITFFFWIGEQTFFEKFQYSITTIFTKISAVLLSIFGFETYADGNLLGSPDLNLRIKKGCDAIAPIMIYSVAVLAYPILWKYKWKGLVFGILAIFTLNVIRIISLFLTGIYAKKYFDLMHLDIWQVLFIFGTLFFWLIWLKWALNKESTTLKKS